MINGIIHSGQEIVTNGLVLHLDAAQLRSYPTTGTTWTDLSGNGYDGTLTNGPTFNSANGGSIVFDGTNDYVGLPTCNFPSTGARSINIWLKNNSGSSIRTLFGYGNIFQALGSNLLHINAVSSNDVYWGFNNADFWTVANVINTTSFFNICCTFSGGVLNTTNVKIYINSVSMSLTAGGTGINSNANTQNSNYRIASDNNQRYYNGNISALQFYNRALSATEVLQNYNATKSRYGL